MKSFTETMGSLDGLEREFLDKVRSFYQNRVGWYAASQIQGLQIQDRFSKPGENPKYRVRLIVTGEKGRLIGRGGAYVNELRNSLNLEIDLD
ncbi:MAG TPA: KH domain-containing protein [Anaerolineaceae bacterium]|nr:KH domain-containing protein [Anaerolineaceae bacterium]